MEIKKFIIPWILLVMVVGDSINFPGIAIPAQTLVQVRRAHKYSQHELTLYQSRKTSKYTLFLALLNYRQILNNLRIVILNGITNYISGDNNSIYGSGNIVIGSDNKIAGTDNWVLTSQQITSTQVQHDILYIGKWRIQLDLVPQVQYRPELAIGNMDTTDQDILRNMKNMGDFTKFGSRVINLQRKL